jgi:predicted DNA-binding transcriptional regulator AlpA
MGPKVLSKREAADRLGISTRTLDRLMSDGRGPSVIELSPRRLGFLEADLDAFIARRRRPAPGAPA